jgi:hypothetical protein
MSGFGKFHTIGPGSQTAALQWLVQIDSTSIQRKETMSRFRISQLFALVLFANALICTTTDAQFQAGHDLFSRHQIDTTRRLPPPPKAFDYFDANNGDSLINRFLLAHLSMKIYNTSNVSQSAFEEHLRILYGHHGITDVKLFRDTDTGADGGVFVTDDAVIVVFRGTTLDNGSFADQFADINRKIKLINVNHRNVGVHTGFWEAAYSVYPEVWTLVAPEVASGKKLWLTGHSLGGAMACMTAFRMQYMDGMPVQGLVTYGAPRVGNAEFYKKVEQSTANADSLIQSTQRFVLDGDPGPTFWNTGWDDQKRKHAYFHFGRTHTIFKQSNTNYVFEYDSGELAMDWIPPWQLYDRLSTGIHMEYEDALLQELSTKLLAWGDDDILQRLMALPMP